MHKILLIIYVTNLNVQYNVFNNSYSIKITFLHSILAKFRILFTQQKNLSRIFPLIFSIKFYCVNIFCNKKFDNNTSTNLFIVLHFELLPINLYMHTVTEKLFYHTVNCIARENI